MGRGSPGLGNADGGARWRLLGLGTWCPWGLPPHRRGRARQAQAGKLPSGGLPPPLPGEASGREPQGPGGRLACEGSRRKLPGLRAGPERAGGAGSGRAPCSALPPASFRAWPCGPRPGHPPVPGRQVCPRAPFHPGPLGAHSPRTGPCPYVVSSPDAHLPSPVVSPSQCTHVAILARGRARTCRMGPALARRATWRARGERGCCPSAHPVDTYQCEHGPGPGRSEARDACKRSRGHAAFPAHRACPGVTWWHPHFPVMRPSLPAFSLGGLGAFSTAWNHRGLRPRPADSAPHPLVLGEHGQGAILGVLLRA